MGKTPLFVSLLTTALAVDALAEDAENSAAAMAAFRDGRAAMAAGRPALACEHFKRSVRLHEARGTLVNLGLCESQQGHLLLAKKWWQRADTVLEAHDPRRSFVKARLAELKDRVPTLRLLPSPGMPTPISVLVDDQPVWVVAKGIDLELDPGQHRIVVTVDGVAIHLDEHLEEGDRASRVLPLPAARVPGEQRPTTRASSSSPSKPPSDEVAAAAIQTPKKHSSNDTAPPTAAIALLGTGAVSLAASGVFLGLLLDRTNTVNRQCEDRMCTPEGLEAAADGRTFDVLATATALVGVGLITGGAAWFALAPRPNGVQASARWNF